MDFSFLEDLNENQRQAVVYNDGPSLIIAGAGSGKTRVLTYKIAYLLKMGLHPSSILALTFTNKASREMKERITDIVGYDTARLLKMGTFHSVFLQILRAEAEHIDGYNSNLTIYESSDSKNLIKSIVRELNLDEKIYKPGFIQSRISNAKNNLITPDIYASDPDFQQSDRIAKIPMLRDIYRIYCMRCKEANAMDFDDLLLQTNLLFRDKPEVLHKYQQIFKYILVDEYQDTNLSQDRIIKKIAELHKRICVVGDDAQSIYSFRGANIGNILQFKKSYPNAKTFKLEQNYRSTQTIVNAANSLIKRNSEQIEKTVFSEKEKGNRIKIINSFNDLEEASFVVEQLKSLHKRENFKYKDFAVLYRTNSQSRVLEEAFRKQNIPYRIYGGQSFYQRKEIKDIVAYFRLVSNPKDQEALKRIINYPLRGIGETSQKKLWACAQTHNVSSWEVLSDVLKYNLDVNAGTATKMSKFREQIDSMQEKINELNAYELAEYIVKTSGFLNDTFLNLSPENASKQENIQELLKGIYEFCEYKKKEGSEDFYLADYLSEISLLTDQDTEEKTEHEKTTLMTVHAAKGLEFKVVFIVGLEEELFPSPFCTESDSQLQEERRLLYVALTRAEEYCFISYARSRFRNGKMFFSNPSRFLKDIDAKYLDLPEEEGIRSNESLTGSWDNASNWKKKRLEAQMPTFKARKVEKEISDLSPPKNLKRIAKSDGQSKILVQNDTIPVGTYVKHNVFGVGKVLETSIADGNEKVEIDFGEKGKKTLLLKFAKLEVLE